jgi:hypothetical protein
MAANFGIDENFAAAVQEHLKTIGAIPDDAPSEGDGEKTDSADSADLIGEAPRACGDPLGRLRRGADFFTPNGLNPLKRLIPKK